MNKPKIICLSGCSGAGKSTYAAKYCAENPNFIIICADTIRGELCGDESCQSNNQIIFEVIMPERVRRAIKEGKSVIVDITSPDKKSRKTVINWARENNVKIESHYFKPDIEKSKRQNKMRERQIPEFVIERQAQKWATPTLDEGFDFVKEIINL